MNSIGSPTPAARAIACIALVALIASSVAATTPTTRSDSLTGTNLDATWKIESSPGNRIETDRDGLRITADENTYAHIEREMTDDLVRVTCAIKPGNGVSWCTSLFVYWDTGNWVRIGIIPRGNGCFYANETFSANCKETDLSPCAMDRWSHVGIELAADCIRYLSSHDGKSWKVELVGDRPEDVKRPPSLVILGKGFGTGKPEYPNPTLNNDYTQRGQEAQSRLRDFRIEATAPAALWSSSEERMRRKGIMQDVFGSKELSRHEDPSFATVSTYYPGMRKPRELVGVRDHPDDVGIATDAAIELSDNITSAFTPRARFAVGNPPRRIGTVFGAWHKHLLDGYLPVVVAECDDTTAGLHFEQTVYGWSESFSTDKPMQAYARMKVTNRAVKKQRVALACVLEHGGTSQSLAQWDLDLAPAAHGEACMELPFHILSDKAARVEPGDYATKLESVRSYWQRLLSTGASIDVSEQRVNDAWKAWMAYGFLNVDSRNGVLHACDGSGFYDVVYGYSAALYCVALDMMGMHDAARANLESLLTFQQPDGLISTNFGHTDMGVILYALRFHQQARPDNEWFRSIAPRILKMRDWVNSHRRESMQSHMFGRHVAYGLIRYWPFCDCRVAAFDYFANAWQCMGLEYAAQILEEVGITTAPRQLRADAAEFRADILKSMDSAVLTLDGVKTLPIHPDTHLILKLSNYTAGSYYGLLAPCVLEPEFLDTSDPRTNWLIDPIEKRGGLHVGIAAFVTDQIDHAYGYGYLRHMLLRGEAKKVILAFYGWMAYGMTRETYAGVECTNIATGENFWTLPHLYSGTQQLRLLRMMLMHEDGKNLLLCHATPRPWLEHGKKIEVRNAGTLFGPLSFRVDSEASAGTIRAQVQVPPRFKDGEIRLRLRHPKEQPVRELKDIVGGEARIDGEVIVIRPSSASVSLAAQY